MMEEDRLCHYCDGEVEPLGRLGKLLHGRCRGCGATSYVDLDGHQWDEPPELPPAYEEMMR